MHHVTVKAGKEHSLAGLWIQDMPHGATGQMQFDRWHRVLSLTC